MPDFMLRIATRRRATVRALAILASSALACRAPDAGEGEGASRAPRRTAADTLWFVQAGSFPDSARAAAVADSLRRDGWGAYVSPRMNTSQGMVWRLRLLPTRSRDLAEFAAHTARLGGGPLAGGRVARDLVPADVAFVGAEITPVNRSSHGMAARVRWATSPDRRTLLVVEDPAAVEAEPVPNGAVVANEATGRLAQVDHVWDVAPSPDWTRLAVSWAFVLQGGEGGQISRERWFAFTNAIPETLARRIVDLPRGAARSGQLANILRAGSFPVSSMGVASGVGLAQVFRIDDRRDTTVAISRETAPSTPVLRVDGWRVRWLRNGNLAVGSGIKGSQDFSPPVRWIALQPDSGRLIGLLADTLSFAPTAWVNGPLVQTRAVEDLPTATIVDADLRRFQSRDGWLRVIQDQQSRVIGPGIPLVATRTGRFVVALVPLETSDDGHPMRLVVYRVP